MIRADLSKTVPRKLGVWAPGRRDLIIVEANLSGWKYDDARQHELCHALWAKLHPETKGQWHP